MSKAYYIATVREFLEDSKERIVGCLNEILEFDREIDQQVAWEEEIAILKEALGSRQEWQEGAILFEYSIPRLCGRIDVVLLLGQTIFVLEFKVGEKNYPEEAKKQVLEYCLDLKYFHKASENLQIVPVLVCTKAKRDMHLVKASGKRSGALNAAGECPGLWMSSPDGATTGNPSCRRKSG